MYTVVLIDGGHYFLNALKPAILALQPDARFVQNPSSPPSHTDLVIFSVFSNSYQHPAYRNVRKIVISGEPHAIGGFFSRVVLAIDCKRISEPCPIHMQKLYWPFFAVSFGERAKNNPNDLIYEQKVELEDDVERNKFCAFLYRNPDPERVRFFDTLCRRYKRVDGLGAVRNNTGVTPDRFVNDPNRLTYNDLAVQKYRSYRFAICFENSRIPGYVTEKIVSAMLAGCIPIYYGAPDIATFFNPKSFVNVAHYRNFDEAADFVQNLDQDEDRYQEMRREPWFVSNRLPEVLKLEAYPRQKLEWAMRAPLPPPHRIINPIVSTHRRNVTGRRRRRGMSRRIMRRRVRR